MNPIREKLFIFGYLPVIPIILIFLVFPGCGEESEEPDLLPRPVKVLKVSPSSGGMVRSFSGVAHPVRKASLAFRVGGKVVDILVDAGDEVLADEILARLDASNYKLDVSNIEYNLVSAQAAARNSENSYRRAKALYENSNISKDDLDQFEAQRNSDRGQVQALEAQLNQARNQLSYTELKAPFAGTISKREIQEYENIAAGQEIMELLDRGEIKVKLGVPENLVARIVPGDEVQVKFESLPELGLPGIVSEVDVAIDSQTGTYPVEVNLTGQYPELRPGMAGEVIFNFDFPGSPGIVVPTSAILSELDSGENFVWLVEDNMVRKTKVKIGNLAKNGVDIISGLKGGEVVVTAGVTRLEAGQKVRILGDNSDSR